MSNTLTGLIAGEDTPSNGEHLRRQADLMGAQKGPHILLRPPPPVNPKLPSTSPAVTF